MSKYLFQVSYTAQDAKGLLEGGGGKRRAATEQAAKSVGGKIESFYFAFGDADAFVIARCAGSRQRLGHLAGGKRLRRGSLQDHRPHDPRGGRPGEQEAPDVYRAGPLVSIGRT